MPSTPPPRSESDGKDPLKRMRVFQLADALVDDSWTDSEVLLQHPLTRELAGQLYTAVCSIEANIAEGYSRSSGRDRARIFEFSLGSARESMSWYRASNRVLNAEVVGDRLDRLEEIRRLLLAIIPRERVRLIRPTKRD